MFFEAFNEWLIYGTQAIMNLFSQYFKNEGFSPVQIGILVTIGRVMSLVANPFWFSFKSKFGEKKTIPLITLFPLILIWGIYFLPSFEGKLIAMALSGLFLSVILPIVEGRVISSLMKKGIDFNPSRLVGSVGFSITAFVAGFLIQYGFIVLFILLSILLFFIFLINKTHQFEHKKVIAKQTTDSTGNWKILSIMLVSGILALSSSTFYATFLPLYLDQKGYPMSFTGISFFIFAMAEIPFLIFSKKIIGKIGEPLLLISGVLACGLRILLSAYCTSFIQFIFICLLHGWGYIVIYYAIYHFIHYHMPEKQTNKAQAVFWMGINGIGFVIGSLLGGFIVEGFGLIESYTAIGTFITLLSAVLFFWNRLNSRRHLNR
ncbi:MAG TPA: MFS transporter [Thermotogota bacterium]|nr:MFS transporter [Thermotogota bacterium]HPJ87675.1 MFS transporter [Thermotogota bacterium]HPR94886.1 MFS transporter [Thermotogota bacterium]